MGSKMACFRKPSDENLEIRRLTRLKTYKQPIKQPAAVHNIDYVPPVPQKIERQFGMAKWRVSQKTLRRDREIRESARRSESYRKEKVNTIQSAHVIENETQIIKSEDNNIPPKAKSTLDRSISTPVRRVQNYRPYD